jgi:hypothetical protein
MLTWHKTKAFNLLENRNVNNIDDYLVMVHLMTKFVIVIHASLVSENHLKDLTYLEKNRELVQVLPDLFVPVRFEND